MSLKKQDQPIGVKGLAQGLCGEITWPNMGFEPETFWPWPQSVNYLSYSHVYD